MQINEWLDTQLGIDIWSRKYSNNEDFETWLNRVSSGNENIKRLIREKKFLFGGRILASRGLQNQGRKITFSNCYVITPPEDNIESIFDCAKKLARTYSYGGGCGLDISKLSPKGSKINNAAKETSGSVSFMDLYSLVTELIGQSGRRGALMISIDCSHPDLEEFINVKSDLTKVTKANISIKITDDFMNAVKNDLDWELKYIRNETNEEIKKTVKAKELFNKLAKMNWDYAEPGILNWDKISNWNLLSEDKNFEYAGVNPCIPLGECVLTSNGFVKIEDVKQEIFLQGNKFAASDLIYNGKKMIYEVELENGIIVKMTDNHKILTDKGDYELKDLKKGDKINVDYTPVFNTVIDNISDYEKGIMTGWFISDGCFMQHHNENDYMLHFSVGIKEFIYADKLEKYIQTHLYDNFKFKPHNQKKDTCYEGRVYRQDIINKFKKEILNIEDEDWDKYNINLFNKSKSFKLGLLRSIFTCDGSSHSSSFASYSCKDKNFLTKIQRLLIEFGVYSNLTLHNKPKFYTAKDGIIRNNSASWKLEIYDYNFIEIGYLTSYKQDKLVSKALKTSKRILIKKNNVKIKSITPIGEDDVYDINVDQVHHFNLNGVIVHNCAEEPLPAGGSCLLGSINLSEFIINPFTDEAKFNYVEFNTAVRESVIALNEVLHEGLKLHPLEEQQESVNNWRQIGLGLFAWHDALIKLGIRYGTDESLDLANKIGFEMINTAILTSSNLVDKYGTYPSYDTQAIMKSKFFIENTSDITKTVVEKKGLANSQLLTIAPTGSIGTMLGVSTGLEPIYNISYTRKTESLHGKDEYYKVYTPIVDTYMKLKNIEKEEDLPDFFNTAMTLNYKERIDMQSIWQKHIDASISSTVNVPNSFTIEQVEDLYMLAWEKGLKGVTLFRDGCTRIGILTNTETRKEISTYTDFPRGYIEEVPEGLTYRKYKLKTGCGNLYFFVGVDENEGKIYDVFTNTDAVGGCSINTQANSRLLSTGLRGGVPVEYLIEQLDKSGTCPSYQALRGRQQGMSKVKNMILDKVDPSVIDKINEMIGVPISLGKSCPSSISMVLKNILKEFEGVEYEPIKYELISQDIVNNINNNNIVNNTNIEECQHKNIIMTEGCMTCPECGYSKCG